MSGFSGMGSHCQAMNMTGLNFNEVLAAEPKAHAKVFLQTNHLQARHHFDQVEAILEDGGHCTVCRRHCLLQEILQGADTRGPAGQRVSPDGQPAPVAGPLRDLDLFTAGFSCQAFSTMRARTAQKVPTHAHPKFEALNLAISCLQKLRPRLALLENTAGFSRPIMVEGAEEGGLHYLRDHLKGLYHVGWTFLDLQDWVTVRRGRWWIFCMRCDSFGPDAVGRAINIAEHIHSFRAQFPAAELREYVYQPNTQQWVSEVVPSQAGQLPPRDRDAPWASWREQANKYRMEWKLAGLPWHDARPLEFASLFGMRGTQREREILQVHFLRCCHAKGLSPLDPSDCTKAKSNLFCDISQNLAWLRPTKGASVYCRESRFYSYEQDRLLIPSELLASMGWVVDKSAHPPPSTAALNPSELQDLIGESQALPCVAACIWALVLAAGHDLPGMWGPTS